MRRRESSGEYETSWQRIPDADIKKFGTISYSLDDVMPTFFDMSGFQLEVINNDGYYSDVSDDKSFWYGYLTRHRTLVKVEAGYIYTVGTEYPTTTTLFVGMLGEKLPYKQDNIVPMEIDHLSQIFKEFPCDQISGLGAGQKAYEFIEKVRDFTDIGANAYFQKFISSGAWYIQSTTNTYDFATSTSLRGMSCWEMMTKLAAAENYVVYVSRDGAFYFQDKVAVTTTAQYHFSGVGDSDKTYGHNIMDDVAVDENVEKVFNRIIITYNDTNEQYVKAETWQWGDSSSSFMYGVRTYEYSNEWMKTGTAEDVATEIYTEFVNPKDQIIMKTKFVPQLMLNDRVSVTYKTVTYTGDDLWGYFLWGYGVWGERSGYNINIDDVDYRITKLDHNIDQFNSVVTLRAIG